MEQTKAHKLTLDDRKYLAVCGVADVLCFNEREVRLSLSGGGKMFVTGENLKIEGFSRQTGEARVNGTVRSIKYSDLLGGAHGFFK